MILEYLLMKVRFVPLGEDMDSDDIVFYYEWPQSDWKQGYQGYSQDYHNINMVHNQQQHNMQWTQFSQARFLE